MQPQRPHPPTRLLQPRRIPRPLARPTHLPVRQLTPPPRRMQRPCPRPRTHRSHSPTPPPTHPVAPRRPPPTRRYQRPRRAAFLLPTCSHPTTSAQAWVISTARGLYPATGMALSVPTTSP